MATSSDQPIEIAPFHAGGSLRGFVVCGRWPDSTKEWMQLLIVTVRIATLPGLLSTTTIFGAREDLPDDPAPGMVGLVIAEGTVLGESAVAPGRFAEHQPPALLMLHPPSETNPTRRGCLRWQWHAFQPWTVAVIFLTVDGCRFTAGQRGCPAGGPTCGHRSIIKTLPMRGDSHQNRKLPLSSRA
ncbi:Uncharacterised protein [Mycobacteroides abscessus subsp. abscessus]|nr:Uncharacterised protein [Mycobacteroides abscessus subsp. abscessus]SKD19640.1 Uncharacterised protein [Mycobacteroides abscessus subsp. abscessus]SKV73686.1 Uncharacterised protein [Mycobacteroides abscessus subsp. abscessus]SKW28603.1 Uncharacterised protein [Mycobacteroides abscessus subsp. abscessus]